MPAILDSLFHKVVDTTSSPIGVEGGGSRSHKAAGPSNTKKIYHRAPFFEDHNFCRFRKFYTKTVSPKYNIYARINHNHISGGMC